MDEKLSMYEASTQLNIKYSTAKSLIQLMKRKGTIIRFFKEKPKKIFKLYKECRLGKLCKKTHQRANKILLQKKLDHNNLLVYNFKVTSENKTNYINSECQSKKKRIIFRTFSSNFQPIEKVPFFNKKF
jgi:hypothetical protein